MQDNQATLSNGPQVKADNKAASIGVMPDVLPEVETSTKHVDLQSGVSVENTHSATDSQELSNVHMLYPFNKDKTWFVLRVTYNRVFQAKELLYGEDVYLPTYVEVVKKDGKRKKVRKPLISNLLFIYTIQEHLNLLLEKTACKPIVTCLYDHCHTNEFGKNPLLTVGYNEMINFIKATSTDATDVRIVDESKMVRYKSDDLVEITGGKFKGVRGRVARLIGQQRVIVTLGFLNFATSYIPNCWLKKID